MGRKSQDHYKIKELRKLMRSHDLIPEPRTNYWDVFINKVLDRIDKGIDFDVLVEFVHYELVVTYGFYTYEVNASEIADSIDQWWMKYSESNI
jgi:hypothetical protein